MAGTRKGMLFAILTLAIVPTLAWKPSGRTLAAAPSEKPNPDVLAARSRAQLMEAYGRLPLSFEANQGQTDRRVKFLSRGPGYMLFLTRKEMVLRLTAESRASREGSTDESAEGPALIAPARLPISTAVPSSSRSSRAPRVVSVLQMRFIGASESVKAVGLDELPGKSNYFAGRDPTRWQTGVPQFAQVEYQGIYPGVDVIYYGLHGQLESDFRLAPGADPDNLVIEILGADRIALDAEGNVALQFPSGSMSLHKPTIFQKVANSERPVEGHYALEGENRVRLALGDYDRRLAVVIDPSLVYSTYVGGSSGDDAFGLAVDSSGNAYIAGYTDSSDFPTTPGAFQTAFQNEPPGDGDVIVAKLDPSGSRVVYSTFLGGGSAEGNAIAVDNSGNAYVGGNTSAASFPTTPGAFQTTIPTAGCTPSGFIAKLNPSGSSLIYSTYLGGPACGTNFDIGNYVNSITVDDSGDVFAGGATDSKSFPLTPGAFQTTNKNSYFTGFVAELNPSASGLVYSTYLGGNGSFPGADDVSGITLDSSGNAYVSGRTGSADFPTTPGAFQQAYGGGIDAFLTKLNSSGTNLVYSTFLGGSGVDEGNGLALDANGNVYVSGFTSSTNFPVTPGAFQTAHASDGGNSDAFVAKLDSTLSTLAYSTYLGGKNYDAALGIAVDSSGAAVVAGTTSSDNFPVANPTQSALNGPRNAFVAKLNVAGSGLLFSTYLGGNVYEQANGVSVDQAATIYVAGETHSTSLLTTAGAFQTNYGGGVNDAFVAKIFPHTLAAQIQPPISTDGSSVFSAKRGVVPVKFTLTADGAATCSLPPATILLTRTAGAAPGLIDESIYSMSADSGSYFRIDTTDCQYVYNLATSSLGPGSYQVQISISDVAVGSATFGLD